MASPVGHAAVGIAVAAVVARATGTAPSAALWVGAIIASGVPDLDVVPPLLGFSRRYHRGASHSLLVIACEILLAGVIGRRFAPDLPAGVLIVWSVCLVVHPLLDVVTSGPLVAKHGWGIPLFWPLSRRRFYLNRPLLGDRDVGETLADALREMRDDLLRIVPVCTLVVLVTVLWP